MLTLGVVTEATGGGGGAWKRGLEQLTPLPLPPHQLLSACPSNVCVLRLFDDWSSHTLTAVSMGQQPVKQMVVQVGNGSGNGWMVGCVRRLCDWSVFTSLPTTLPIPVSIASTPPVKAEQHGE